MSQKVGITSKQEGRRVAKAVVAVESSNLGGRPGSRWDASPYVISAIIDDKTGSGDSAKYAWTAARLDDSDTLVEVTDGLSGDTTKGYAVDPLGGEHAIGDPVTLLRVAKAKSGGGFELGWIIVGGDGRTFPVKLDEPASGGGSNGTQTTKATFVYVVKGLSGNVLDGTDTSPIGPKKPREKGALVGRAERGLACWDENGDLSLEIAYEEYDTSPCGT